MSKHIPNSFQVPNALVDELMAKMSGNALKCYLQIVRQTIGWNKEVDYIPASQFHALTGIRKADTLTLAIKELEDLGLIIPLRQKGKVTGYRVNMEATTPNKQVHPKKGDTHKSGTPETHESQCENHPRETGTPENRVHPENGDGLASDLDANQSKAPPIKGYTRKSGTPDQRGVVPPINGGGSTPDKRGTSKPNTKPTNTKPNIYTSNDGKDLTSIEDFPPPVPNGRFRTWEQLGYKTLPDSWRVMALEKYPELNDQSLQNLWNGHEANCMTKPGLSQLIRKWEAGWIFTLSNFATGQIQRQQPKQARNDQQQQDQENRQTDTTQKPRKSPKVALAGIELIELANLQKLKPEITEQQVIDFAHAKGVDNFQAIQFLKKHEALSI